jgi:hypothetical protein
MSLSSFFLAVLGFELRTLCLLLLGKWSIIWATLVTFFVLVISQIGSCTFCLGWLQTMILQGSWDYRCVPSYMVYLLRWDLTNFCSSWPWNEILPISTSQVAGITCLSHCIQPLLIFAPYLQLLVFVSNDLQIFEIKYFWYVHLSHTSFIYLTIKFMRTGMKFFCSLLPRQLSRFTVSNTQTHMDAYISK